MVDLMALNGCGVEVANNKHYTDIVLIPSHYVFRADTTYEAIRKAFTYWTKHNA